MTLVRGASQPATAPRVFTPLFISQGEQGIQGIQGEQGIQGIQGIQGDQGIPGVDGADGADGTPHFLYDLVTVSSWTQDHTFDYPPSVRLVNDLGEECDIYVEHTDSTHVHISFPTPFTGKIILS